MNVQQPDDDPVVASYDVFLNPSLPHDRKLWVLQQPNRSDLAQTSASEMRLKSQTGMVEVDIPLDYMNSYDRDRGMHYGRHLKNSLNAKSGGTHGLSGGFGVGAPPPQRGKKKTTEDNDADLFMDWVEAVRQDKVLRTMTMGGQCPDHKEVQYMIGVFQGGDLHVTPVSNLVHLRPQLHHIDAVAHQERLASSAASKEASGPAAGGAGAGPSGAKAIHMTIKQGGDNDAATQETMLDRLRAVQQEDWRKLKFTDENDEAAWDVYQETLIIGGGGDKDTPVKNEGDADAADKKEEADDKAAEGDEKKDKGKAKAKAEGDNMDVETAKTQSEPSAESGLGEKLPQLQTTWDDGQLLEAVSGIVKPKILTREEKKKLEEEEAAAAEEAAAKAEAQAQQAKSRGRGGATAGRGRPVARRGRVGSARGGSAGNAMDLT